MSWKTEDSAELYGIKWWGEDYFAVNDKGSVTVTPNGKDGPHIDLAELTSELEERGIRAPITIRFADILKNRVSLLANCFRSAIKEFDYQGKYAGVYPIKVNQQRHVVKEIVQTGRGYDMGLECGSKPELLVTLSQMRSREGLIICNGFKDIEYIDTAVLASKMGFQVIVVVDRAEELPMIIESCKKFDQMTGIGFRAKLGTKATGMWTETSGTRSKFGLTPSEMVNGVELLKKVGMVDSLKLLHYHIGSQIPSIQYIKSALREGSRFYGELHRLGAPMGFLDVGGGLGVDYDGSGATDSSMNYSVQEYANDVVSSIGDICSEMDVPHPNIVTEAGRALTAHHSVLVFNVLGRNTFRSFDEIEAPTKEDHSVLHDLFYIYSNLQPIKLTEYYNDFLQAKSDIQQLFIYGVMGIRERARAEDLCRAIITKMEQMARRGMTENEELEDIFDKLQKELSDVFFCNFSVFQSLPDSWALGQVFPVMPIQRLNEEPDRLATVADLTCDSDGKIEKFICTKTWKGRKTLPVHNLDHRPYYLAVFLTGAYQEILGDLHNLFGDTDAVTIKCEGQDYEVESVVTGDSIDEVLGYLEYPKERLIEAMRKNAEESVRMGLMSRPDMKKLMRHYEENIQGYTYLEEPEH
jgi:arginine decarboxylase